MGHRDMEVPRVNKTKQNKIKPPSCYQARALQKQIHLDHDRDHSKPRMGHGAAAASVVSGYTMYRDLVAL